LRNVAPDSTGYGYRYASLGHIIEETRPVLKKYGLAVTQFPSSNGKTAVTSMLIHESGQFIEERFEMPELEDERMNGVQAAGAAITYARRYAYASIIGITAEEDTDAATKPSQRPPVAPRATQKQKVDTDTVMEIRTALLNKLSFAADKGVIAREDFIEKGKAIHAMNDETQLRKTLANLEEKLKSAAPDNLL